jgi:dihydrofolate reductase
MRRVIASLFLSLDGVVESPEKWHFPYANDEMGAVIGHAMAEADAFLVGRVGYQEWAEYWPAADNEMADYMNDTRKYVVSRTLTTAAWQNSTLLDGDISEEVPKLKEQPGKNITVSGSATLVRSLLDANLLDELRLMVHPIVVGSGRRLFEDSGDRKPLELVDSRTFSTGVVDLTYRPSGE